MRSGSILRGVNPVHDAQSPLTPVFLNLYDLFLDDHSTTILNNVTIKMGFGAFHTGLQVYGKEYSFSFDEGIYSCSPYHAPCESSFRKTILMGHTCVKEKDIPAVLLEFSDKYAGPSYRLFKNNCNHFTDELCQRLTGQHIPRWINNLSKFLKFIDGAVSVPLVNNEPNITLTTILHDSQLFNAFSDFLKESMADSLLPLYKSIFFFSSHSFLYSPEEMEFEVKSIRSQCGIGGALSLSLSLSLGVELEEKLQKLLNPGTMDKLLLQQIEQDMRMLLEAKLPDFFTKIHINNVTDARSSSTEENKEDLYFFAEIILKIIEYKSNYQNWNENEESEKAREIVLTLTKKIEDSVFPGIVNCVKRINATINEKKVNESIFDELMEEFKGTGFLDDDQVKLYKAKCVKKNGKKDSLVKPEKTKLKLDIEFSKRSTIKKFSQYLKENSIPVSLLYLYFALKELQTTSFSMEGEAGEAALMIGNLFLSGPVQDFLNTEVLSHVENELRSHHYNSTLFDDISEELSTKLQDLFSLYQKNKSRFIRRQKTKNLNTEIFADLQLTQELEDYCLSHRFVPEVIKFYRVYVDSKWSETKIFSDQDLHNIASEISHLSDYYIVYIRPTKERIIKSVKEKKFTFSLLNPLIEDIDDVLAVVIEQFSSAKQKAAASTLRKKHHSNKRTRGKCEDVAKTVTSMNGKEFKRFTCYLSENGVSLDILLALIEISRFKKKMFEEEKEIGEYIHSHMESVINLSFDFAPNLVKDVKKQIEDNNNSPKMFDKLFASLSEYLHGPLANFLKSSPTISPLQTRSTQPRSPRGESSSPRTGHSSVKPSTPRGLTPTHKPLSSSSTPPLSNKITESVSHQHQHVRNSYSRRELSLTPNRNVNFVKDFLSSELNFGALKKFLEEHNPDALTLLTLYDKITKWKAQFSHYRTVQNRDKEELEEGSEKEKEDLVEGARNIVSMLDSNVFEKEAIDKLNDNIKQLTISFLLFDEIQKTLEESLSIVCTTFSNQPKTEETSKSQIDKVVIKSQEFEDYLRKCDIPDIILKLYLSIHQFKTKDFHNLESLTKAAEAISKSCQMYINQTKQKHPHRYSNERAVATLGVGGSFIFAVGQEVLQNIVLLVKDKKFSQDMFDLVLEDVEDIVLLVYNRFMKYLKKKSEEENQKISAITKLIDEKKQFNEFREFLQQNYPWSTCFLDLCNEIRIFQNMSLDCPFLSRQARTIGQFCSILNQQSDSAIVKLNEDILEKAQLDIKNSEIQKNMFDSLYRDCVDILNLHAAKFVPKPKRKLSLRIKREVNKKQDLSDIVYDLVLRCKFLAYLEETKINPDIAETYIKIFNFKKIDNSHQRELRNSALSIDEHINSWLDRGSIIFQIRYHYDPSKTGTYSNTLFDETFEDIKESVSLFYSNYLAEKTKSPYLM